MGSSWMVQVFEMSDDEAQRVVGGLLSGIDGISVELAFRGPDRYLVASCESAAHAIAIQRFMTAVDPRAVAIQTSTRQWAPAEVPAAV